MDRLCKQRCPVKQVIFRDWDLLYKRPFYPVTWREGNKIGYVCRDGTVLYPYRWGMRAASLESITAHHKKCALWEIPLPSLLDDNIEIFHTQNYPNPQLFFHAIRALKDDLGYFDHPIKLPRLAPISAVEFEARWATLESAIRAADSLFTIDTKSRVSRLIARLDGGPWSHVATFLGDGLLHEAVAPRVTLTPLSHYHDPRFRLGLYRVPGEIASEKIDALRMFAVSTVGDRYNYHGMIKVGLRKLILQNPKRHSNERLQISPNEMPIYAPLQLIHIV